MKLADHLHDYYEQHLTHLQAERTKIFFQIITLITEAAFQKKALEKEMKPLLDKLKPVTEIHEMQELLPYEDFWEMMVTRLG